MPTLSTKNPTHKSLQHNKHNQTIRKFNIVNFQKATNFALFVCSPVLLICVESGKIEANDQIFENRDV
jgi:hypothetical protein